MATETAVLFPWKASYNLNIPEIDRQHQGLVQLINSLHASMSQGGSREKLGEILDELIRYTENHFKAEEALMERHAYSGIAAHRLEHKKLTQQAYELRDKLRAGKMTVSMETMRFLKDWLSNHILRHDQSYAKEFGRVK